MWVILEAVDKSGSGRIAFAREEREEVSCPAMSSPTPVHLLVQVWDSCYRQTPSRAGKHDLEMLTILSLSFNNTYVCVE